MNFEQVVGFFYSLIKLTDVYMTTKYLTLFFLLQFISLILFGQEERSIRISPVVDKLYMKCGNKLKVSLDGDTSHRELKFIIEGGFTRPGNTANEIIIFPSHAKVFLRVYDGDEYLGVKEFQVQSVPKPTIIVMADNESIHDKSISRKTKTLHLKAICDSTFTCFCPTDNLYKITYKLIFTKNGSVVYESSMNTSDITLKSKYMNKADKIEVVIESVKKVNYIKEEIEINFIRKDDILSLL